MNKLLQRQIKRFLGEMGTVPQPIELLLEAINDAYDGFDEDRGLIERALDISSEELTGINRTLRQEVGERKDAQEKIRQTLSLLTATLESTADGILVIDLNGKVVSYNQKFQQMWHVPDEIIESKDDDKLLKFVLNQLADPEEFLTEVRRLYASIEEESSDLLEFKDGRVFERFSQPQKIDDKIVGRVWSFHDVTARKQAEKRLMDVNTLQKLLLPSIPIEQKLKFVTDTVVRILDADFARIWTIMPGDRCDTGCTHAEAKEGPHVCRFRDKCLHLIASSGRYTHLDGKGHCRVPFGCYKIGLIAAGKQDKFLTNEAATDSHIHNRDWARELGLVSFAGYRLTHTDGTPLGVLATFSKHPISTEEDALLEGIAHSTSMVLHASQAAEALRHEKDFAQSLTDTAQIVMLVLDTNARIVKFNPYMEEISGYKLEEVKGKDWFDTFLPKADHSRIREVFKQSISGVQTKGDANPIITKDGREVLIEWYDKTLKDKDGRIVGLIAIGQDITERKKTEDTLRKNEEFTRRVIESSSDCIKVLDLEGRLLSMSGGGQKLLEIDNITPYLNISFIDFWKGKEREGCLKAIAKAKQGGTGVFYGYFKTAKGTPKSWEVIVTPIKDSDGSISRLLAVSRDITERKKSEKSIENLNKDLKSTVAMLTQSNRQLREFAHLAAHDLKTPLRGISTLAQWLVNDYKEKFDDQGRRQVDLLIERVGRINELVDTILEYSTIGRNKRKERPVDLNGLVGAVLVETKPPPDIKITINKKLPVVICDEMHLWQIFHRLLANAVRFIDKPEGRIAIDYTDKGDLWEFSVSDNGMGIAPRHFEKIFQLFQTLNDTDQSKGGGVGLTFVRKIVELYGGQIRLTSDLGQGSTFFFTLPKDRAVVKNVELEADIVG